MNCAMLRHALHWPTDPSSDFGRLLLLRAASPHAHNNSQQKVRSTPLRSARDDKPVSSGGLVGEAGFGDLDLWRFLLLLRRPGEEFSHLVGRVLQRHYAGCGADAA